MYGDAWPCIERGLGEFCHPFEEGDQFGGLRERVRRLEVMVEGLAAEKTGRTRAGVHAGADAAPSPAQGAEKGSPTTAPMPQLMAKYGMERAELVGLDLAEGDRESKDVSGRGAGGVAGGADSERGCLSNGGSSWFGELALPSVSQRAVWTVLISQVNGERFEIQGSIPRAPAGDRISMLISEGGARADIVEHLFSVLPPRETCDMLVDIFFEELNGILLPVHRKTFNLVYDEFMEFRFGSDYAMRAAAGARHIPFMSSLFMFFALAHVNLPTDVCSDREAMHGAVRLFHAGCECIEVSKAIRSDHIDLMVANVLAAKFCTILRRTSRVWLFLGAAVRVAQALGLNRDGSKMGLDAVTTERRRRLWSIVYSIEKVFSILVSRPSCIVDRHCDTLPPSDIDLDTLGMMQPAQPPVGASSGARPSEFLYLCARHGLAVLMSEISDMFLDLTKPVEYADVLRMDVRLEQYLRALPPVLQPTESPHASRAHDDEFPFLPLFRSGGAQRADRADVLRSDARYAQSQQIAFAMAKRDRAVRDEYNNTAPELSARARICYLGVYRLFNTTLMFGIMLLLEKDREKALSHMEFLRAFVDRYSDRKDICSRREVQIIKMFLVKAEKPSRRLVRDGTAAPQAPATPQQQAPATPQQQASATSQRQSPAAVQSAGLSTPVPLLRGADATLHNGDIAQEFLNTLGGFGTTPTLPQTQVPLDAQTAARNLPDHYNAMPFTQDINGMDLLRTAQDARSALGVPSTAPAQPLHGVNFFDTDALASMNSWPNGQSFTSLAQSPSAMMSMADLDSSVAVDRMSAVPTTGSHPLASTASSSSLSDGVGMSSSQSSTHPDTFFTPWGDLIDAIAH
ncbi:hypothetical protein MSPP1_002130 [Malassezia sp. CBS 17886]|nr:hypothetical protein MSPP1_002130 [Malassezia sp. CBS 17886]